MKLSSVLAAALVSLSLAAVPACKKDKKNADDKAGETTPATDDKAAAKPAGDMAGGEAKAEPAAATAGEAKAEPAAGGEPPAAGDDKAGGEKKEGDKGGW
jgi:hypothetical protein